jgi:hypothetical protein
MSEAINRLGDAKNFVSLGYTHSALMAIDDAIKILQAAQAQAPERKCSECGNNENDLALYCVRCLNNDGWYLTDDAQAQSVNQQLLEALVNTQAIIEMLYPKINRPDALNLQIIRNKAAIAAAQEVGK